MVGRWPAQTLPDLIMCIWYMGRGTRQKLSLDTACWSLPPAPEAPARLWKPHMGKVLADNVAGG